MSAVLRFIAMSAVLAQGVGPSASAGAMIGGRLLEGLNGERPARRATVTLASAALRSPRMDITDDDGRFTFDGLPAGLFTLTAGKAAFVNAYYGSARPGRGPAAPIALAADERRRDVTFRILRGAAFEGRVADERGRPWSGLPVSLIAERGDAAGRTLVPVAFTRTDDRGQYRFFGLAAGRYLIAASAAGKGWEGAMDPEGRERGYAPVLYPGATDVADARVLEIGLEEERTALDFVLTLMPVATLHGRVVDSSGAVPSDVQLRMVTGTHRLGLRASIPGRPSLATGVTVNGGAFFVPALPPGLYTLFARGRAQPDPLVPSGAPGPVLWGLVDLALSENTPAEAVITLRPAFSIAGKVAVDGAALDPASLLVRARPLSAELSLVGEPARVQPDGSFELTGLSSGSYRLDVEGLPASWAIQSMRRDDADILDTPLDVVADTAGVLIGLTNRPSRIAGRLLDAQGRPAIGCRIVVFPLQRVAWGPASRRTLMVPVASDGGYAVSGLTAGAYLLVAITDLDDNDLHDPTFLESLVPAAVPIALTPGEHRALDLRIGGEPE